MGMALKRSRSHSERTSPLRRVVYHPYPLKRRTERSRALPERLGVCRVGGYGDGWVKQGVRISAYIFKIPLFSKFPLYTRACTRTPV